MPKPLFVRPIRETEARQFLDWSIANKDKSAFDPAVASYPSTLVPVAYDSDGPVAYMPIQRPFVLESLAPRPGLTDGQTASVLKEIFQFAVTKAHEQGAGEILFFATDDETVKFAERHKVFSYVPYRAYRVKISELEKQG